jgi:RHS repeat-associated protein
MRNGILIEKSTPLYLLILLGLILYTLSGITHHLHAEELWLDKSAQFDIKLLNPIRSRRFTYALSPIEITNLGETLTGEHRLVITSLWPENMMIEGTVTDQNGLLFYPFNDEIVSSSTTKVTLKFLDAVGHSFGYQIQVQQRDTSIALPPDPKDIAPPLNPNQVVNMKDAVEFLFTGENPIQTGVSTGDLVAKHIAVIRGQVLNKDNSPLSGVAISVKDHPQYGQTLSRTDGMFDMAVNGGDIITVNYTKNGYLPVQRQIKTLWRDYAMPEDVVMISLDPQVSTINLTSNQDIQVAQGSIQTDADGARQATIFFPKGTSATMVLPNGSTQSLTTLNVRATEYTVGENGRNAMPGELPPFSGYTYAVELSADEAITAGATRVNFNQEIPFYVDNFLDFPTGEIVPIGWYDHNISTWIPSKNGRIIKILNITDGHADIDVDGNGSIADQATLSALGITEAELRQLSNTFTIGKSLWRMPVSHFTPWDGNWPYGPPLDAEPPLDEEPETPDEEEPEEEEEDECEGCIIKAQSQTLGEKIDIIGTDFSLHYRSDRSKGNKKGNTILIPVTGEVIPNSMIKAQVTVEIMLQKHIFEFPPVPNQEYTFTWDGLGGYGRPYKNGNARITVAYEYPPAYYPASEDFSESFNRIRGQDEAIGFRGDGQRTLFLQREWNKMLFAPGHSGTTNTSIAGIGLWSFDDMHVYDRNSNELLLGSGGKRTSKGINNLTVNTISGNGTEGFNGDGAMATDAILTEPSSITTTSNGDIYFVDTSGTRIRKITSEGVISTIAGTGDAGFSGDEGSAIEAELNIGDGGMTLFNNNLYIADTYNHRIRKIDPYGIITTVAGNTEIIPPCEVDCIPQIMPMRQTRSLDNIATETKLYSPKDMKVSKDGTLYIVENYRIRTVDQTGKIRTVAKDLDYLTDIALLDNGSFYFTERGNKRIRYMGTDGLISTVAGEGYKTLLNGALATDVNLNSPTGISLDKNENLYFSLNNKEIYKLGSGGILQLIAGNKLAGYKGDTGNAIGAKFNYISDFTLDIDNNIYITDKLNHRIRIAKNIFPKYSDSAEIIISSDSGEQLYIFEQNGHHLKTIDTVSDSVVFQFSYTSEGYLNSVIDVNGRVTTFERHNDNTPTAIISPDGQRTELYLDENGYLNKIINPKGEFDAFSYSEEGLLLSHADPKNNTTNYQYDLLGRFIQDQEPNGGGWTVSKTTDDIEGNYLVSMASKEGRINQFEVKTLATGEMQKRNTVPNGAITTILYANNGIENTTYANGNTLTTQYGPDPRFGMLAPSLKLSTLSTPSGLKNSTLVNQEAVLNDKSNLLSHSSLSNTVTNNNNTRTNQYTTSNRTWTNTTPEGRISTQKLDATGHLIESTMTNLAASYLTYNTDGRVSDITQGNGVNSRATTMTYYSSSAQQGFLQSITDATNRVTSFSYDNAGRLLTQTLPNGNDINFNYDANGNTTSITPENNKTHRFDHTKVDEKSSYTPPDVTDINQTSTQYRYNFDKQLELITLPDGQKVDFIYHETKGHKIKTQIPRGNFDYTYNDTSGQIEQVTAPDGGTLKLTYDGNLILSAQLTGAVSGKINQSYNNDFQVTQRCVNTSDCIDFSYDKDLLLTQAGDLTINRAAQKGGLITGSTLGNISTSQTYNIFGEPLSFSTNDSDAYSVDYIRDKLGRIIQKVETIQGITTSFEYSYDLLGQLSAIKTNGVQAASYTFDNNGNRTHENGITTSFFDSQDRLKQRGDNNYLYSDNGDLLSKTNTVTNKVNLYHYDVLGNLISAAITEDNSTATTQIEYIIDAQNRRIGKKVNNTLTQGFLYKDQLNPIAELDGNGAIVSRFIYGSKAFVPDYMIKDGKTYRIISDHLGSPRLVINTNNSTIAQRLDYDVWGNITQDTNPGFQPFGFAGGLYDQDTKFTRFGARDYDADIGRWTTKDPIGLAGGLNVYGYVSSDPVNNIDPDGRIVMNLVSGAVGAALAGYKAYSDGGSAGDIAAAAVVGGVSNLLSGKALLNATMGLLGNLAGQTVDPCFNGFDWSQAGAAALLGKYNVGGSAANKLVPKSNSYVGNVVTGQAVNNAIVSNL